MIGILNAYHFDATPGNYQEEYTDLILDFVQNTFPEKQVRHYKVGQNEWPKNPNECAVWIITGSAKGAYDTDPWIQDLKKFVINLNEQKKKLIGICFGHQLIAAALGGEVIKSPKGWGVGVREFKITTPQEWMKPELEKVSLIFSHQDQVVSLPKGSILLAQDPFCEFQMYQISNHILTLQGHPEFSVEFAKSRLLSRKDKMPPETFDKAMVSFENPKDDKIVAEWIRNFAFHK